MPLTDSSQKVPSLTDLLCIPQVCAHVHTDCAHQSELRDTSGARFQGTRRSAEVTSISWLTTVLTASRWRSSFSEPSSANAAAAWLTANCVGTTSTPSVVSTWRTVNSPRTPPRLPGEAASSPAILPLKAFGSSGRGREIQSMVFLSSAVIELLYSGQLNRNASFASISALSARALSGKLSAASISPSYNGIG